MIVRSHPATTEIKLVQKIAELMDSKFIIPGTKIKFGLDPLIGLIPGLGLLSTTLISLLLVTIIGRHGTSGKVIILMILNILIDTIITSIPFIGSFIDVFFRANNKNINLLTNYYNHNKHQSNGLYIIVIITTLILVLTALITFAVYKLISYLINLLPF